MAISNSSALILPAPSPAPTNGVADTNDIMAIKAPVEIPSEWIWLLWTLAALALAALLVWAGRKLYLRLRYPPLLPVMPPHQRARQKLKEALALIAQPKPFCIAVSDVIRIYLEERFFLRAPERTTEEFLNDLQTSPALNGQQKNSLADFLARCDMVKFAKYEPTTAELNELYDAALRLVEETVPVTSLSEPTTRATVEPKRRNHSMAGCSYCGSAILFGGKQEGDLRFCNATCQEKGVLIRLAKQLPADVVEEAVRATYAGSCPKCQGHGPVDVHTSYRVWSALLLTSSSSRPQVCCSSCGRKAKIGDALFCLLLGWWGFPWGLIFTPVQISRNLLGLVFRPNSTKPTDKLRNLVSVHLAASVLQQQQQAQPSAVPPPR
jgi:hypothetical protein